MRTGIVELRRGFGQYDKTMLAARAVTEAMLTEGKTGYTNPMTIIPKKKKEIGEDPMATSKRDKAWDTFYERYTEFRRRSMLHIGPGHRAAASGKIGPERISPQTVISTRGFDFVANLICTAKQIFLT